MDTFINDLETNCTSQKTRSCQETTSYSERAPDESLGCWPRQIVLKEPADLREGSAAFSPLHAAKIDAKGRSTCRLARKSGTLPFAPGRPE